MELKEYYAKIDETIQGTIDSLKELWQQEHPGGTIVTTASAKKADRINSMDNAILNLMAAKLHINRLAKNARD